MLIVISLLTFVLGIALGGATSVRVFDDRDRVLGRYEIKPPCEIPDLAFIPSEGIKVKGVKKVKSLLRDGVNAFRQIPPVTISDCQRNNVADKSADGFG